LPAIVYTLGDMDPRAEMLGAVVLAPVTLLFNLLAVTLLLHYGSRKSGTAKAIRRFFIQVVSSPLIMACKLGIVLNLSGLRLPPAVARPLDALGNAALPMILMSIGASLEFERLRGTAPPALIASLIKVALTPMLGFLLAGLFSLDPTERMIAVFYLAAPAAGMSYVMAEVMGSDGPLAGRIVALSTLLSAITLPIIIAIGL
jgi:predicted permease